METGGIEGGAVCFGLVLLLYAIAAWLTEEIDRRKERKNQQEKRK